MNKPALHFWILGVSLWCLAGLLPDEDPPAADPLVVPASQIELARLDMEARLRRPLTGPEATAALKLAVDEEILLRFALDAGIDHEPEIADRLAQVGSFVSQDSAAGPDEWAEEARRLGLHRGDRVARSLLVDRARRLIRGAVLIREPSEAALSGRLAEGPEDFQVEARHRVDVVPLGRAYAGPGLPSPTVLEAGVESHPFLTSRDLARRFGMETSSRVAGLMVEDGWQGPLPSMDGPIAVRLVARRPARPARLDEVRSEVRAALRQELADRWLEARLSQLAELYQVEVEMPAERIAAEWIGKGRNPS